MSTHQNWVAGRLLLFALVVAASIAAGQDRSTQGSGSSPALDQLKMGFGAMGEGLYEEALDHYAAALEHANTRELRFQALLGLGSAEAALDRLEDARKSYEQALDIKPDSPEALFSTGMVAKDQGDFDAAAELFAKAAVRRPDFAEALTQLGVVYAIAGRHDEAAASCRRAVSVNPQDVEALLCLGVAMYHLGRYGDATVPFDAVIAIDPANSRARYSLGLCKLMLGNTRGAAAEYKALEELDPDLARDLFDRIQERR